MIIVETVPLDATDLERAAKEAEIARLVSDLADAGLNPCLVAVESHAGGDSFVIEADLDLGDN